MKNPEDLTPIIDELRVLLREEGHAQIALRLSMVLAILDTIRRENHSLVDITIQAEYTPSLLP